VYGVSSAIRHTITLQLLMRLAASSMTFCSSQTVVLFCLITEPAGSLIFCCADYVSSHMHASHVAKSAAICMHSLISQSGDVSGGVVVVSQLDYGYTSLAGSAKRLCRTAEWLISARRTSSSEAPQALKAAFQTPTPTSRGCT